MINGIKKTIKSLMFKSLKLQWQLPSGVRVELLNHSDWLTYNEIFVNEEYQKALMALLDTDFEAKELLILDLGAHAGFFTRYVIDRWLISKKKNIPLTILQVEADPNTYKSLCERMKLCHHPNLRIKSFHGLVGKKDGVGKLTFGKHENMNYAGENSPMSISVSSQKNIPIQYLNIEDLVPTDSLIGLIKCDIEGSEFVFIQEYQELIQRAIFLVIEVHLNCGKISEVMQKLRDYRLIHVGCLDKTHLTETHLFKKS